MFFNRQRSVIAMLALAWATSLPTAVRGQDRFNATDARTREAAAGSLSGGAGSASAWQGSSWLGGAASRPQWRLGVEGSGTETGMVIRTVAPRSAAERALLEPGDVIVAVEGYQVGSVAGRLYSLPDELNRRADANGSVGVLVHDNRSGRLASIRVQMDRLQQNALTGTLVYTGRSPLPSDAIVTVTIENVSRPFYIVGNGSTTLKPTSQSSIPFQIVYDPSYIDARDVYRVRAMVTSGGRTILETPNPANVLTQGNPSDVRLNLSPLTQTSLVSAGGSGVITAGYPNLNNIDDRITAMYQQYLGRRPSALELAALHQIPGIEARLETMPLELMAAQEYFDLVGNNNLAWLDRVFQVIVKQRPTQQELEQWMRRYADLRYSRTELLRQLSQQARR